MTNEQRREYLHGLVDYIEQQVQQGFGGLQMSDWHCGTAHCVAGWCQVRDGLRTTPETAYYCFKRKLGYASDFRELTDLVLFCNWEPENRKRYNDGDRIGALRAQDSERYQMACQYFEHLQIQGRLNTAIKCDGRCQSAKRHVCECSCGGKNHGIGSLVA